MKTLWQRLTEAVSRLWPLTEYLVLRTETHAYCAALAFFALLALYPFSSLLLSFARHIAHWEVAYAVIADTLREYYPTGEEFLLRNLEVSVATHGSKLQFHSIIWIMLGLAGFFVPLETAFNRAWEFPEHRPYWKNQLVGFFLTVACCGLALLFVLATAGLHTAISAVVPWGSLAFWLRYAALKLVALPFSIATIFIFYRFLPNGPVRSREVLPAAILAGVIAEVLRWVYLLALPFMQLQKSQGPYYVSISFAILAYFESFAVLGGAFLANERKSRLQAKD
ncbi:MAG: YihY/virulence factor BrkB family protein [Acidobacteriota bacterium]